LLHGASAGALDKPVAQASEEDVRGLLEGLLAHINDSEPDLLPRITGSGLLGEAASQRIGELTAGYLQPSSPDSGTP
jgi:hypothetical protein